MQEPRSAPRRRVLKGAIAAFQGRHATIDCTVRDISETGCRIVKTGSINLPDTFELILELDGISIDCEVVWRKTDSIGVRFVGNARAEAPKRAQVLRPTGPAEKASLRRRR